MPGPCPPSAHDDRLVERNRAPSELAKEVHFSALCDVGISDTAGLRRTAFRTHDAVEQVRSYER